MKIDFVGFPFHNPESGAYVFASQLHIAWVSGYEHLCQPPSHHSSPFVKPYILAMASLHSAMYVSYRIW